MQPDKSSPSDSKQGQLNLTVVKVVLEVGFITLAVVLGALFGGVGLDGQCDSKPAFTIGVVLVSIPVSLVLILVIVKKEIAKIKTGLAQSKNSEEAGLGK
mgnify:CR=1 FL=1